MSMNIYAHRGYSAAFPENTLAAFQGALDLGVFGVELDIHTSSDGIPVVIHDEDLVRTSNGSGLVIDKTAAQLAELDAGNGEGIPAFAEVLALANGRLRFDIEIKARNCEQGVLDLLARYPETIAAISCFEWDVLSRVRELDPAAELWVLADWITEDAIVTAQKLGATTLAIEHSSISEDSISNATAEGLQVMAWTVNSQEEANRLRDLGVAAICTDDPGTVR
jgi:glycerophosphoryl diester phosphodiesterase